MNNFYAYLNRMKYIKRWALMNSLKEENIMEHTESVVTLTHALCVIQNKKFGGKLNIEKAVLIAQYHEVSEVITGDLPTPIKYFNPAIKDAYKSLEVSACQKILNMLPDDIKEEYTPYVLPDDCEEKKVVKFADRLSALIKCIEELKSGNKEFKKASDSILKELKEKNYPALNFFINEFLPSYSLTLDELD